MDNAEVLKLYTYLIFGLLVLVGVILTLLQYVFHKNATSLWRIYRGWLVMAPLFLGVVWWGRAPLILGIFALSIFSFIEFARATELGKDRWICYMVIIGIITVTVFALMPDPLSEYFGAYSKFMATPVYIIGLILLVPVVQNRHHGQLTAISLGVLGFIYFGWMFMHLGFLADSFYPNAYVLYLVFAVEMADISAYVFGKLFGRRKLRSNISPNKTVEGSIGALVVSLILPWVFKDTFVRFGTMQLILTGLIVGVGGQLGDLVISMIKRDVGIKDMGVLIPGHGGILDRVDSLIFATPLFFHMIRFFNMLYP